MCILEILNIFHQQLSMRLLDSMGYILCPDALLNHSAKGMNAQKKRGDDKIS